MSVETAATQEATTIIKEAMSAKRGIPSYIFEEMDKDGNPTGKFHIDPMRYSDFASGHFSIVNFLGTLYLFDIERGVFRPSVNQVETHIRDTVKEHNLCDRLSTVEREIMVHLKSMGCVYNYPFVGKFGSIHVANGSLDIDTGVLSPSTPDMLYDYRVETPYKQFTSADPQASCTPELDEFLKTYGTTEPIDILAKCIWQRAFNDTLKEMTVLFGPKDCGKTTLVELVQACLDGNITAKKNVSRTLLHELLQRFGYSGLEGKLLCYGDDLPDMFVKNSGRINEMVGSVVRHIEKKGIDGYDAITTCYFAFSANNLPPLDDDDSVIWGKLHLVEFSEPIPSTRIPRTELFTQTIREQLLFRAIEKVQEWRKHPYVNNQNPDYVRAKWHESSTDVDAFLLEAAEFDPSYNSTLDEVKKHYESWCVHNLKKRHMKYLTKKIQPYLRRINTGNVYCLKLLKFKAR